MGNKNDKFDDKGEKIQCRVCNCWYHRLEVHIKKAHAISRDEYLSQFPDSPTISLAARRNASGKRKSAILSSVAVAVSETPDQCKFTIGSATLYHTPDSELTTEQKANVPKHDENWIPGKREQYQMEVVAAGIEDGDNIFIIGPPGGGKTTLVKEISTIMNVPCLRMDFTNAISVEDFIGEVKLVENENGKIITVWNDGLFVRAWREGYHIVFDEFTGAPANIMLRLHGPLEGDNLIIMENGGEIVPKHPRTRIFATDNTNGRGDDTGMFAGTNIMNEATLDRFGTVIKFSYPDKATEKKILVAKAGVSLDFATKMVSVATAVRVAFDNEECYCTLSTRRLIGWAKKTLRFGDAMKAADVALLGKLSRDDVYFVRSIIQRNFGGEI